MIGTCEFKLHSDSEGEVGYLLQRDAWGQGYATEAAAAVVNAAITQLGMHRIIATCAPENAASARILEKLGMRREGHLRRHMWLRDHWRDSYLYAVLDDEWQQ